MATTANKIKLVDNRVERAKSFLLYQFQDKENLNKIVEALVEELQEAEYVLIDLQDLRMLENATGVQLDNIGDKLKVRRNNLDDNDYKTAIKVRILRKANNGTKGDIANIFRLLTLDDNPIIHQTHPYVVELTAVLACISQTSSGLDELLALFPVNTGIRIIDKPKRPFGFSGNPDAFPLSSIAFDTPQGQMSSLIRTSFGVVGDNRFQTLETYVPPTLYLPVATIPPSLSYTPPVAEGTILTVNSGTWDGDLPITYQYQWFSGGSAIDGETNGTYTVVAGDLDKSIYCRVIASNNAGDSIGVTEAVSFTVIPTGGIVSGLGVNSAYGRYQEYIGTSIPANKKRATIGLRFDTTGVVTLFNDSGDSTTSDYLETTGVSAAADYEIAVFKLSGDNLSSPTQIGIWQTLTTDRAFSLSTYRDIYGRSFNSGVYNFSVRNKTNNITESKDITFSTSVELDNGF